MTGPERSRLKPAEQPVKQSDEFREKPLTEKYDVLLSGNPEFSILLSGLQQFSDRRSRSRKPPLSNEDERALLFYSAWVENPNVTRTISSIFSITEREVNRLVDKAIYQLEPDSEELFDIIESLRPYKEDEFSKIVEEEYHEFRTRRVGQKDFAKGNASESKASIQQSRSSSDDLNVLERSDRLSVRIHRTGKRPETIKAEGNIIRLSRQSLSIGEIATALGISYSLVRQRIYLLNLEGNQIKTTRKGALKIPPDDLQYFQEVIETMKEKGAKKKDIFMEVLKRYMYLFDPNKPINLAEIADLVGTTREYARQIYNELSIAEVAVPPRQLKAPVQDFRELDLQIIEFRNRGFSVKEIASRLEGDISSVRLAVMRLVRDGQITFLNKGRKDVDEWEAFHASIKSLREKKLSVDEMATQLGVPRSKVANAIHRLIKSGELQKVGKKRSRRESRLFQAQVEGLLEQDMSIQIIAERLGESVSNIRRITKEVIKESPEYTFPKIKKRAGKPTLISKVRAMRNKGLNNIQIALELNAPPSSVSTAAFRLMKDNEIPRLTSTKEENLALEAKVRELRKQKLTIAQIAVQLDLPRWKIQNASKRLNKSEK